MTAYHAVELLLVASAIALAARVALLRLRPARSRDRACSGCGDGCGKADVRADVRERAAP